MSNTPYRSRNRRAGVTMLEILIVLAIIALLAAVVAPRIIGYLARAKSQTAGLQIGALEDAARLYYIDVGQYPPEQAGLTALLNEPAGASNWRGPYLDDASALRDPWQRPFLYSLTSDGGILIESLGRDGARGGNGEDMDLSN